MATCAVCLKESSLADRVTLRCSHAFCNGCLKRCADFDHDRCPICRRPHLLDPDVMKARFAQWRMGYSDWRRGAPQGARGEVAAAVTAVAAPTAAAKRCGSGALANEAFPPAIPSRGPVVGGKEDGPQDGHAPNRAHKWVEHHYKGVGQCALARGDYQAAMSAWTACLPCEPASVTTASVAVPGTLEEEAKGLPKKVGAGVWAGQVVTEAPETLLAVAGWAVALASAAAREEFLGRGSDGAAAGGVAVAHWRVLAAAWLVALLSALPGNKASVDRVVPKTMLIPACNLMFASEGVGMVALAVGCAAGGPGGVAMACLGALITTQAGQLFRLQRKTTGARALDTAHLLCLTTSACAHHLASFACLPNPTTAAFVLAWRFVSISGHAIGYLRETVGAPAWVLGAMGWGRYALCVLGFQPLALAAVLAACWGAPGTEAGTAAAAAVASGAPSWGPALFAALAPLLRLVDLDELGRGLAANAAGHVTYLLFRLMRLEDQRRDRVANGLAKTGLTYGRQAGLLEGEMAMLAALATALLLAPHRGC
mmetsp:Transcript_22069/g.30090  ORF Transcript_22069/g.30090 Transcript_22069/m.30090 type:complete len:540 (-) Transcript_22069:173-1792(-)